MPDKYLATWVSHTSLRDFLACPRAYFLHNVYKDPKTGHKVTLMSPPLALGQAVHEVLEGLSTIATKDRFNNSLLPKLDSAWKKVEGKRGGFFSEKMEEDYKNQAKEMLLKVQQNPGPLANLAVKIKQDLPHYWLSEEDEILLCGKVDWLEYLPDEDAVHIIDFKTGKAKEEDDSLQLPIYHLLVKNCQQREVAKASYWYLRNHTTLTEKEIPDIKIAHDTVLKQAKKIKLARKLQSFQCPQAKDGCFHCRDYELVFNRQAEFVGLNDFGQDVYVIEKQFSQDDGESSMIL